MSLKRIVILLPLVACLADAPQARPCIVNAVSSARELVAKADAVVRAQALDYAVPPSPNTPYMNAGAPDSRIRFYVVEVIKGGNLQDVVLPGYFVLYDDFNDRPVPYDFVRKEGRRGSCFAHAYRRGAEYLLFLKRQASGDWTVNWAPLAAVNEQLHSSGDPWLQWVRNEVQYPSEKVAQHP